MRNLLGRLNARSADDLQRIARFWQVPLSGDRGRQVGMLYRTMSDIRAARSIMQQLDPDARTVVRELATAEADALPIAAIADLAELPENITREVAIRLFRTGILAREGDSQELPVGAIPRLFLPREMGLVFRRVQDELDAGDISNNPFRILLQVRDSAEIEEAAMRWGINVVPGLRARDDLIGQILRQISADRIEKMTAALGPESRKIWNVMQERSIGGPLSLEEVLQAAALKPKDDNDADTALRVRDALDQLETSLLVLHTYDRTGERCLFVPREILQPDETPLTVPLRPLEPVEAGKIARIEPKHPHALAWDLLTVLREIANHGAPIWTPGEPLSRSWQRRLNGRLWFSGDEVPPEGYLGFLLQLALAAGLLQRTAPPAGAQADRNAIVPVISPQIREWRSRDFAEQSDRLRSIWLASDEWIEARERGEVNVWGPDWRGFRRKMLESAGDLDPETWFMSRELAKRMAESDPALIGSTFTVASSHTGESRNDRGGARIAAIAHIVRLELDTAFTWFGIVEPGYVAGKGTAIHITGRGQRIATEPEAQSAGETGDGPDLSVTEAGTITVQRPSPLHIWSLTAFADAGQISFEPSYQLRPRSVGRALGAGFDLEQIVTYLERQIGTALPDAVQTSLREWAAGYRRVRMRRAIVLTPDAGAAREDLERVIREADLAIVDVPSDAASLYVLLPPTDGDAAVAEEKLLSALRAGSYLGQWTTPPAAPRRTKTSN